MAGGYSHLLVVMSPTAATKFGESMGARGEDTTAGIPRNARDGALKEGD